MKAGLRTFTADADYVEVDYHMHTEFSDGDGSVRDYAERAEELGLEEIAITDHVWRSSDWVDDYVEEVRDVSEEVNVRMLAGLEAKVVDREGNVDVKKEDAGKVDFVMGVVHRYYPDEEEPYDDSLNFSPSEAAELERDLTLRLLENPVVDVVGHPSRTYYKFHYGESEEDFPKEYFRDMIDKAVEVGKPLEYNARLPRRVRDTLLGMYLDSSVSFTVGSDSHTASRLDNLAHDRVRDAVEGTRDLSEGLGERA